MKRPKQKSKLNPNVRNCLLQSRCSLKEFQEVLTKATIYNRENVSEFVREAALNYRPLKRVQK